MEPSTYAVFMVIGAFLSGVVGFVTNIVLDQLRARATRRQLAGSLLAEIDGLIRYLDRVGLPGAVQRARQATESHGALPQDMPDFFQRTMGVSRPVPMAIGNLDQLPEPIPSQLAEFGTRFAASIELVNLASEPTRAWLDARNRGDDSQYLRGRAVDALKTAEAELSELYSVHGSLREHLQRITSRRS